MDYMAQARSEARKIAEFLCRRGNIGKGIDRHRLAAHLSTPEMPFYAWTITYRWPLVEAEVAAISAERGVALYPFRPFGRWGYRCGVHTEPIHAMFTALEREQNILTRMSNDVRIGTALRDVAESGTRFARTAGRMFDRQEDYLATVARHTTDREALKASLLREVRSLPDITV